MRERSARVLRGGTCRDGGGKHGVDVLVKTGENRRFSVISRHGGHARGWGRAGPNDWKQVGSSGIIVEPPLESHECKAQGRRQDPPPLREGGGAAMDGMSMTWQKTSGRGRGGGSTAGGRRNQAQLYSNNKQIKTFADRPCGSMPRRPPAVLPPPPFPPTPNVHSCNCLPPGGTPLSEGGECSRTLHSPTHLPTISRRSSPSTKFPEAPGFWEVEFAGEGATLRKHTPSSFAVAKTGKGKMPSERSRPARNPPRRAVPRREKRHMLLALPMRTVLRLLRMFETMS